MAMQINVLGKIVPVLLQNGVSPTQWSIAGPRVSGFAQVVAQYSSHLNDVQNTIFRLTDRLAVFIAVPYEGYTMTRSFMDLKTSTFYWAVEDLISAGYVPMRRIPCYYYHDAFHIRQHAQGANDPSLKARVDREVEASVAQIEIAQLMQCDPAFINWLIAYAKDRKAIEDRLKAGTALFRRSHQDHMMMVELEHEPNLVPAPEVDFIYDTERD